MNFNNIMNNKVNTCGRQQPLGLNNCINQAQAKLKLGNRTGFVIISTRLS
jgi:hypothetical protein